MPLAQTGMTQVSPLAPASTSAPASSQPAEQPQEGLHTPNISSFHLLLLAAPRGAFIQVKTVAMGLGWLRAAVMPSYKCSLPPPCSSLHLVWVSSYLTLLSGCPSTAHAAGQGDGTMQLSSQAYFPAGSRGGRGLCKTWGTGGVAVGPCWGRRFSALQLCWPPFTSQKVICTIELIQAKTVI